MAHPRFRLVTLAGWLVLVALAIPTFARATVFRSNADLWRAATVTDPLKPRPWFNLAAAVAEQGQYTHARLLYAHVLELAEGPTVSPYHRAFSRAGAWANLARLDRVEGIDSGAAAHLAQEFPQWAAAP